MKIIMESVCCGNTPIFDEKDLNIKSLQSCLGIALFAKPVFKKNSSQIDYWEFLPHTFNYTRVNYCSICGKKYMDLIKILPEESKEHEHAD